MPGSFFRPIAGILVFAAARLIAQPEPARSKPDDPSYLAFTAGCGEALDSDRVFVAGLEYRFRQNYLGIHPYAHAAWTTYGDSYLGAGLYYSINLGQYWRATISSGPGYYRHGHFWKDLGSKLEFDSSLEISKEVARHRRIGLRMGHVSNAGVAHYNPGSETLELVYSIPLP